MQKEAGFEFSSNRRGAKTSSTAFKATIGHVAAIAGIVASCAFLSALFFNLVGMTMSLATSVEDSSVLLVYILAGAFFVFGSFVAILGGFFIVWPIKNWKQLFG
jgi:hypothetical protein